MILKGLDERSFKVNVIYYIFIPVSAKIDFDGLIRRAVEKILQ